MSTTTTTTTTQTGTTGTFKYIDPTSYGTTNPAVKSVKPFGKVDGGGTSYDLIDHPRKVTNIRPDITSYTTDNAGFAVYNSATSLAPDDFFNQDDAAVRGAYYDEVEALVKSKLGASKVVIFDHTIRRRVPDAPRQPVQQVHVDQTPAAAEVRVRRHLPAAEAEEIISKGTRYQIVNVWRPIGHPASDFPLAVVDWRTTQPEDFVPVDLLYPDRSSAETTTTNATNGKNGTKPHHAHGDDDRGKEAPPLHTDRFSREGYIAKGETYGVAPNDKHQFFYVKDMTPDETMFIKCFDSRGDGFPGGKKGLAMCTPHTAFEDPQTKVGEKGRQSIEVRCLVFYD